MILLRFFFSSVIHLEIAIPKFDFEHRSVIHLRGFGTFRLLRSEIKLFTDSETFRLMGKEHAFVVSNHKSDIDWLVGWLLAQVGLCGFLSIYFLKEAGLRMKNFKGAKLEAAQEYAASAGLPVPRNVLIPHTKAVSEIRSFVPAIYEVTVAIPKSSPPPTMLRLFKGKSSVMHVHLKRHLMKDLPETDDAVAQWFRDMFVAKLTSINGRLNMATFRASSSMSSSSISSSSCCRREIIRATINMPKIQNSTFSLPNLTTRDLVEQLKLTNSGYTNTTTTHIQKLPKSPSNSPKTSPKYDSKVSDRVAIAKLYAIMEAVDDRVEMHKNVGEQRSNWNSLLLTSINAITLTASTMAGIAATTSASGSGPLAALKLSSTLLYLAATGMLLIMNKLQPSQLAEEQRNAARLFKQIREEIHTTICIGNPSNKQVKDAMKKVLALDKAYPLPLLGVMLDKFPKKVDPATWWPQQQRRQAKGLGERNDKNGWDAKLEDEMREIVGVLNRKDKEDYLRLGEKALKLNKILAISGPLLTGLAAIGSAFVGSPSHGSWAVVLGVVGGALSSIVNTLEHGGQIGMVFEMYRSNAGFFKLMEESIESNLKDREVERRENGELLEMKVALQLGRSLSELKDLAASSSVKGEAMEEFASKLF
ncbi:unnamed protein product [Camellia sinensis]